MTAGGEPNLFPDSAAARSDSHLSVGVYDEQYYSLDVVPEYYEGMFSPRINGVPVLVLTGRNMQKAVDLCRQHNLKWRRFRT